MFPIASDVSQRWSGLVCAVACGLLSCGGQDGNSKDLDTEKGVPSGATEIVISGHSSAPLVLSGTLRHLFQSYLKFATGKEPLGVLGKPPLESVAHVGAFLRRPERVFAIVSKGDMCAVRAAVGPRPRYFVLDHDESSVLLANHLPEGVVPEKDPIQQFMLPEAPEGIQHPLAADFVHQIEVLGFDMPRAVDPGRTFQMALYFKVTGVIEQDYRVAVHFDDGDRTLFRAVHAPLNGVCGSSFWRPGEYLVDAFEVPAGPSGDYLAWLSLFRGPEGHWKNLSVVGGDHVDAEQRVSLGNLCVGSEARCLGPRNSFSGVKTYRKQQEPLGIVSGVVVNRNRLGGGRLIPLAGTTELVAFLKRSERVLAIVPASELCALSAAAGGRAFVYHVLHSAQRWVLTTNRLMPGEQVLDPMAGVIGRVAPERIGQRRSAFFGDAIELLGYDMPRTASLGELFAMTLYFRIVAQPPLEQRVFVHFEDKRIQFHGDHPLMGGRCGSGSLRPGDFVTDHFVVRAGDLGQRPGLYSVWVGFYGGAPGAWENLAVTRGAHDPDQRVRIGEITLK